MNVNQYDIEGNVVYAYGNSVRTNIKYLFDNNNNVLEEVYLNTRENDTIYIIKYKYDSKNNKIEQETFADIRRPMQSAEKFIYKYSDDNKLTEERKYNAGGKQDNRNEYIYENGYNNVILKYDRNNSYNGRDTLKYDKNGNNCEIISYKENNTIFSRSIYEYDGYNKIKWEQFNSDGSMKLRHTYTYDKKGNLTGGDEYDANGKEKRHYEVEYTYY